MLHRQVIVNDVAKNSKISPLLPYFVSFISTGMQKHAENQVIVARLLLFMNGLFSNKFLSFVAEPYVSVI